MERRELIKLGVTGWILLHTPFSAYAKSPADATASKKIVWLVLRGAMDSLHAVIPHGDPYLLQHRAALLNPTKGQWLPLNQQFSLHPALKHLHSWYQQQQMSAVVAVASPYRARSHFDAQDMLESGLTTIDHNNGWLARAFQEYRQQYDGEAVAIARSTPVSLRGETRVLTMYPSTLPEAGPDLYQQLTRLYQQDPLLGTRLQEGLEARNMMSMEGKKSRKPKFAHLAKLCGELLSQRPEAHCAMLEMGGWDTHNAQINRLNRQFGELDDGLAILRAQLGEQWNNTVIIIATEFGRTVAMNGTRGTDHGTASALLLAGGAVKGGYIHGQWPGLAPHQLYQNRDLQPTSDIRGWIGGVLRQHWQLMPRQITNVFPDVIVPPTRLIFS